MTLQNLVPSSIKDDYDLVHAKFWNTCSENGKISKDTLDLSFKSSYAIDGTNDKRKRRKLQQNFVIISPLESRTAEKSDISDDIYPFRSNETTGYQTPHNRIQKSLHSELQFRDSSGQLITDWASPCSGMGTGHVTSTIKVRDLKSLYFESELSKDVSIRNMCISFLGNQGLLGRDVSPTEVRRAVLENSEIIDNSQPCEICGDVENTQNMLLCDHCEKAFHASCINVRTKTFDADEWYCQSCSKLSSKSSLDGQFFRLLEKNCSNRNSSIGLSSIQIMMKYPESFISRVRIGESFQAEVPEWSDRNSGDCDCMDDALEMDDQSDSVASHVSYEEKSRRSNMLSSWLQCREVSHDVTRTSSVETICGKWRRAPWSEVQTNDWDCSCSVLWDPSHSDCTVPQELPTEQVLLQLKYIEQVTDHELTNFIDCMIYGIYMKGTSKRKQ